MRHKGVSQVLICLRNPALDPRIRAPMTLHEQLIPAVRYVFAHPSVDVFGPGVLSSYRPVYQTPSTPPVNLQAPVAELVKRYHCRRDSILQLLQKQNVSHHAAFHQQSLLLAWKRLLSAANRTASIPSEEVEFCHRLCRKMAPG